jgi:hypothetical protein
MLWYKAWLETRWRLVLVLGFTVFFLGSSYSNGPAAFKAMIVTATGVGLLGAFMLAGNGIATQGELQSTKGLHGSMHFTLSMPVTRLRLLAVRAGLGWLELTAALALAASGMWTLFPMLRAAASLAELFEFAATLVVCSSAFYSLSVLLATFLDDQIWRVSGNGIALGALWWVFNKTPLPASVNIFRAMGEGSPRIAHAMPWTAMGVSAGMAVALFVAAWRVVQMREY